jgi:hypothetical protein
MTGLETFGLVLKSFPLVVSSLEKLVRRRHHEPSFLDGTDIEFAELAALRSEYEVAIGRYLSILLTPGIKDRLSYEDFAIIDNGDLLKRTSDFSSAMMTEIGRQNRKRKPTLASSLPTVRQSTSLALAVHDECARLEM